jgi:hypothetical protein
VFFGFRRCAFSVNSLEPVAQLRSLRQLLLELSGITAQYGTQLVVDLLSSAVQGCLLKIQKKGHTPNDVRAELVRSRDALVAERGSRNVPVLRIGWLDEDD